MPVQTKEIEKQILKMTTSERASLAMRLINSLDSLDEKENERLWIEEADKRYKAYKEGRITSTLAKDAIKEARLKLK